MHSQTTRLDVLPSTGSSSAPDVLSVSAPDSSLRNRTNENSIIPSNRNLLSAEETVHFVPEYHSSRSSWVYEEMVPRAT